MRILFDNDGHLTMFDSEQEFVDYCREEEIEFESSGWRAGPKTVYMLPDNMTELKVEEVPRSYRIVKPEDDKPAIGHLPAPLEGETVGAYARRISGGI